jgi:hypothetical protein
VVAIGRRLRPRAGIGLGGQPVHLGIGGERDLGLSGLVGEPPDDGGAPTGLVTLRRGLNRRQRLLDPALPLQDDRAEQLQRLQLDPLLRRLV